MKDFIKEDDYTTWDKEIHRVTAYKLTKHTEEKGLYTIYKPQMEICYFCDGSTRSIRNQQVTKWVFIGGDIEFEDELECLKYAVEYRKKKVNMCKR